MHFRCMYVNVHVECREGEGCKTHAMVLLRAVWCVLTDMCSSYDWKAASRQPVTA